MKRVGLVVGKFAPLHRGHEFLINQSLKCVDELIIISYSVPEFTNTHAKLRQRWLKNSFPTAQVIVLSEWDVQRLCTEFKLPYASNIAHADIHRQFCFQILNKYQHYITDVFSSESYGNGFAEHLTDCYRKHNPTYINISHHLLDIDRAHVPISATKIREKSKNSEDYISTVVANDYFVSSLCLIGAESTGKSTLSNALAKNINEPLCQEYGRELWESNNGTLTEQDLLEIAKVQCQREDHLRMSANKHLICDTSPLTTLLYFEYMFGYRPQILDHAADRRYNKIYLCAPDFPMVQDGTRSDESFRQFQHEWYLKELEYRNVEYTVMEGTWREKLHTLLGEM